MVGEIGLLRHDQVAEIRLHMNERRLHAVLLGGSRLGAQYGWGREDGGESDDSSEAHDDSHCVGGLERYGPVQVSTRPAPHLKAFSPVSACPRTSECTSWVPSYV